MSNLISILTANAMSDTAVDTWHCVASQIDHLIIANNLVVNAENSVPQTDGRLPVPWRD